MRKIRITLASLTVAVLGTTALTAPGPAWASCIPSTAADQRTQAILIFEGRALDGPTSTGVQRFQVSRYLKGKGPAVVRVQTGNKHNADGSGSITSVSLVVAKGERWRIFARGTLHGVVQTSVCAGSRKL